MQLNFQYRELVLSKLSEGKVRRMTFSELKEATKISRGLVQALYELRVTGRVYFEWSNDALRLLGDNTVMSLCSVIVLEGECRLTVLAPDEATPMFDRGGVERAVWNILVYTQHPDPVHVISWDTADFESLFRNLEDRLYNLISSSLVDETAERVEKELRVIYDAYHARVV